MDPSTVAETCLSTDKTEVDVPPPADPGFLSEKDVDHLTEQQQQQTEINDEAVDAADETPAAANEGDTTVYPPTFQLVLIILALCLAIFLVALDQTIIAPALGTITDHFHSVSDIVSFLQQQRRTPSRK